MSLRPQDALLPPPVLRKRTSSFSVATTSLSASPRPTKTPRTHSTAMGLRRTESYISLPTATSTTSLSVTSVSGTCRPYQGSTVTVPYQQSLQYYKDQRQRRKAATRASLNLEPITFRTRLEYTCSQPQSQSCQPQQAQRSSRPASTSPPSRSRPLTRTPTLLDVTSVSNDSPSLLPSSGSDPTFTPAPFCIPPSCRASSPLSPNRYLLPGRPVFPRSRQEPDLYRKAITTCMRYSPEGQKILRMGPRLALSILTATQELEKIVAEQENREDMVMEDRSLSAGATAEVEVSWNSQELPSTSWIDVRGEDWEMVDCSA